MGCLLNVDSAKLGVLQMACRCFSAIDTYLFWFLTVSQIIYLDSIALCTGVIRVETSSFQGFYVGFLDVAGDWNFRVLDKRIVIVKTPSETVRKVTVLDVLTNLTFAIEVPEVISMDELSVDQEILANLRVYTAKTWRASTRIS
jgi:hypothetical protein